MRLTDCCSLSRILTSNGSPAGENVMEGTAYGRLSDSIHQPPVQGIGVEPDLIFHIRTFIYI